MLNKAEMFELIWLTAEQVYVVNICCTACWGSS